jgi:hypothetical protein
MTKLKQKQKKDEKNNKKEEEIKVEGIYEPFQMENDSNMLITLNKSSAKSNESTVDIKQKEKKKLTKKERVRLEKVLERKDKTLKRSDLLEKLAAIQVNANELKMYSSVRNIGQKEKKVKIKNDDDINNDEAAGGGRQRHVNSIAGSNKRKKYEQNEQENNSTDTDDISTDSEIDEPMIQKAIENFKNKKILTDNKNNESDDEEQNKKINGNNLRVTKYVHVDRRKEIQV